MLKPTLIFFLGLMFTAPIAAVAQGTNHNEPVDLSMVDERPVRVSGRALLYPPLLLASGVEGEVLISYIINENGRTDRESIRILESAARGFAQAATDFVKSGRFEPAKINGLAVKVAVEQVIRFDARNVGN